jgi:integrase
VLAAYAQERGPLVSDPARIAYAIQALAPFWGDKPVSAINGAACRAYVKDRAVPRTDALGRTKRAGVTTARRELGALQAALNHAHAEGRLMATPRVRLPERGAPKDRWLTREEAARLLRAAAPHVRRFILIGLYTGTRATAILRLRWEPSLTSGWVDLKRGVLHRRGAREVETKKRRGSVAMPRQLVAHMRRWARDGGSHVVMFDGAPLLKIRNAFNAAVRRAGLVGVTPHTLKHTAVTWAFQRGMSREDAADYFDTTAATLESVYRSQSPDHQVRARRVMESR